jgi:uncharacterized protein YbjT (DUF2867 family)
MKNIAIVIGATGLVGRALVGELLAQETISKVVTLTRRPLLLEQLGLNKSELNGSVERNADDEKFENHIVDFSNLAQYSEYFKQSDMLFSCLGTTKKSAGSIESQRIVDVDYQYEAARLAQSNGVTQYYLVSSSGASSASLSPYLKMKGELEDKVIALGFKRCVIFQPSLLLGTRETQRPGEFLAGKIMPLLAYIPLLKRFRPIKGCEVAQKMALVATHDPKRAGVDFYALDEIF